MLKSSCHFNLYKTAIKTFDFFQVVWFIINVYSNFDFDVTNGKPSEIEDSSTGSHETKITEDNFYLNPGRYTFSLTSS